jgi:epoxyqueuosine reductase QueG
MHTDPATPQAPSAVHVKSLALRHGFDRVGITRPRGEHAPGWATNVVVLGLATPDDGFDYVTRLEFADGTRRWHKLAYEALTARAALLALDLTVRGVRCGPVTLEDSSRLVDLRAAAVEAGLGVLGLNGLVVDREFGPRVRWTALFVAPELPADRPLNEYYCNCCTLCWTRCPTGALGPNGLDRSRCVAEFAPSKEMMALQRTMRIEATPLTRLQCNRCITACPIGRGKVATYYDEG